MFILRVIFYSKIRFRREKTMDCFLFEIFKWRQSSYLFMYGSRKWRKCRRVAQAFLTFRWSFSWVLFVFSCYEFNLYKYIYHPHHHVMPLERISLTLSRPFSLSFIASGRSSGLHPISSHSCCMYVRAGRPAFAQTYVGVYRSTSFMS